MPVPLGALVPNVEMVWARARAEEAVASQTHRALFTFVAKFCLTPVSRCPLSFSPYIVFDFLCSYISFSRDFFLELFFAAICSTHFVSNLAWHDKEF